MSIKIILGYNASGKSTLAETFVEQGYLRINRDEQGGSLDSLLPLIRSALNSGQKNIVLDNTYPNVQSRKPVIELGLEFGVPVDCLWMTTSFEDAQLNACLRMVAKHERLLYPEDFKNIKDPNSFPPAALFQYRKKFETPTVTEGFASVEKIAFERKWGPEFKNKALILDYDDTLRRSLGPKNWPEDPEHVEILPNRSAKLSEFKDKGYILLGVSNQSAISKGLSVSSAIACFEKTNTLLGHNIEYMFCPHKVPPVGCYCRKPHPGHGAYFIWKHKLNPSECIFVGDQTSDKTFAMRCGFKFSTPEEFFDG